ncbi:MAG: hypothetical protein K2Q33_03820, partial [Gammaproteobacteria bacterium]|nr:hypothetical protein [Gammaproteobacteria bacterium]
MKGKFIVSRVLDLYTLLLSEKENLPEVYADTSFEEVTPSWVMEVTAPGHTLLLHNEAAAASEEYAAWMSMRNQAILIEDIFAQRDQGEKIIEACQAFIVDIRETLRFIQRGHAENLEKLTDDIIIATLVQNDIQRVEQMANDLSRIVQEHQEAIQRHQNAINHCAKLIFHSSLTLIDHTLEQKFTPIEQKYTEILREIAEFKAQITEKQLPSAPTRSDSTASKSESMLSKTAAISAANDHSGHDTVEDKAEKSEGAVSEEEPKLLHATDISQIVENSDSEMSESKEIEKEEPVSLEEDKAVLEVAVEYYVLEEIDITEINDNAVEAVSSHSDSKLSSGSEKSNRAIQLHESADIHEYTQKVIASLRYWDRPEKSDLLGPFINYRAARAQAIKRLVHQLALSLALHHPQEEIDLLYRWIEICRGKHPQDRLFNPRPLERSALERIQQDSVLSEIYFKLPRGLQQDLHPKADEYAEKTGIINSTRSIDDTELNEDQIAGQWLRFIHQELEIMGELPAESSQCRLHDLMQSLTASIALRGSVDDETTFLWKKQLKAAYKMYELVKGIPSEERLVTQEPLTEDEYQLIQTHPSFKPIFINLPEAQQEKLRQERYKSILLNVLAAKIASTPGLLNIQGNLSHDIQLSDDALVRAGEAESMRGFRFLVEQDFFQYQLKYEANEKLIGILENKGFSASEARSVLGFMREQVVYSIFTYLLTSRAQTVTAEIYMVKGMPHYIHIYKEEGKIFFEVNSSPWLFFHVDKETSYPLQPNPEVPSIFYDAEFRLRYELRRGKTVSEDSLQLVEVTTDTPASWTLLNFDSLKWRALPTIERHIIAIDKIMIALSDANPVKQQEAKNCIERWLSAGSDSLNLKDYELIHQHLISISKVGCLLEVIGRQWLEDNLLACDCKIAQCREEQRRYGEKKPRYVFSDTLVPFDAQEIVRELMSEVPDRVAQAKDSITQFLASHKPSIAQCELLRDLLHSMLPMKEDGSVKERLWLGAQIKVCDTHIAAARSESFDVPVVVAELMFPSTQVVAQQKIEKFLNGPRVEHDKYSDLARLLMDFCLGLGAKGANENLISWLDTAIDRACGGVKKENAISASIAELPQNSVQPHHFPPPSAVSMPEVLPTTTPLGRRTQVSTSMAALMRRVSSTVFHRNDK